MAGLLGANSLSRVLFSLVCSGPIGEQFLLRPSAALDLPFEDVQSEQVEHYRTEDDLVRSSSGDSCGRGQVRLTDEGALQIDRLTYGLFSGRPMLRNDSQTESQSRAGCGRVL